MPKSTQALATIAEVGKTAVSGLNFLILAVVFGPHTYGEYVLVAAVAAILVPFATAGYANWVQPLATEKGAGSAAAAGGVASVVVGLPTLLVVSMFGLFLDSDRVSAVVFVLLSEMVIYPIWTSASYAFLAGGMMTQYMTLSVLVPGTKLFATMVASVFFGGDIVAWGALVSVAGLVGFVATLLLARSENSRDGWQYFKLWISRGFRFATVGIASSLTDNIDRLVVGSSLGAQALGVYGMSGRLSAYGSVPVKAVAIVAYPEFFKLADRMEYVEMRNLMRRTICRGALTGLVMWILLIAGSIVALETFLDDYQGLVVCTVLLGACVPLRAIQYGAGDTLYALDNSGRRLLITLVGAGISAVGALSGSILAGLTGAAVGLLIAQFIVAGLLWAFAERSIKVKLCPGDMAASREG